jgi:hypothetical protein
LRDIVADFDAKGFMQHMPDLLHIANRLERRLQSICKRNAVLIKWPDCRLHYKPTDTKPAAMNSQNPFTTLLEYKAWANDTLFTARSAASWRSSAYHRSAIR